MAVSKKLPLLLLSLILLSCNRDNHHYIKLQGKIFGTTYSIKYLAQAHSPKSERIHNDIKKRFNEIDLIMSTWKDNSELSMLNKYPIKKNFSASEELVDILILSKELNKKTEGAFDISIGPLVNLWGFGPNNLPQLIPTSEQINQARHNIGLDKLHINKANLSITKEVPLYLTLSAIAKGYAVDEIAKALEEYGISDYLVEVGGEIRVLGSRNTKDPGWRIAIEQPDEQGRNAHQILELVNLGMATSGDYRNYYEKDGMRYSHIIDPITAKPVKHNLASVSVIHPNTAIADAWATGLFVLGTSKGLALAEEHNIAAYFISRSSGDNKPPFLLSKTTNFNKIVKLID